MPESAFEGIGANLWLCHNCHKPASPPKFKQTVNNPKFSAYIYCATCFEELFGDA